MLLVRVILYVVAVAFLLSGCEGNQSIAKPNLIVISIDTLRADHLGCYGYDKPTSPLLDKLASQGVLFEMHPQHHHGHYHHTDHCLQDSIQAKLA